MRGSIFQRMAQRMAIPTAILFFIFEYAGGCANRQSSNVIKEDIKNSPSKGHYISDVPFIPQEEFYCGPASLVMVMNYYGVKKTQEEIAKEIYLKKLKGTLNTDLLVYARENGFNARYYNGSIDDIKANISKNMPLILLVNLGFEIYPVYHYMVAVGFHDEKGFIIAHSGRDKERIFSYKELTRIWEKTSFGTLLVIPSEKIQEDTLSASEHTKIGVRYESKGEDDLAIAEYKKAIQKDANYALAYFNLANIYLKKGSYDEAERNYLTAIENAPSSGIFYNNLAWLYIYGKPDLDAAERFVKDAIRLDPSRKYIYSDTLGVIYTYKKDFKTAEGVFKDALNAVPPEDSSSIAHIYLHMIDMYAKSGDGEKLEKIRERLKELVPANNTLYRIPHH